MTAIIEEAKVVLGRGSWALQTGGELGKYLEMILIENHEKLVGVY